MKCTPLTTAPHPTIARLESEVRGYCRSFPAVFARAEGATLFDAEGRSWLDFFAGAGVLNYGHNPAPLREALMTYLIEGGIAHALDLTTEAKIRLLERFEQLILRPRDLRYKVQFPGPTGTNAVEAAVKLARKVTGRSNVVSFTNGFHGMTLGSLALTGNHEKRYGAGVPLSHVTHMPFDGYFGPEVDTVEVMEQLLTDPSSGHDVPAAFIVETVQAEGGVNVASVSWLRNLAALAKRLDALLIVDDIQVGCGRTGPFFSFEPAGITPDIVCLSKALSGFGMPLALTLIRPELDQWAPGEHNGTFRGHNLAFVTAAEALTTFWQDDALERRVRAHAATVAERFRRMLLAHPEAIVAARGRGLIHGLAFADPSVAASISRLCFTRGLVIETAGPEGEVVKALPPLTIEDAELARGLDILEEAVRDVCAEQGRHAA